MTTAQRMMRCACALALMLAGCSASKSEGDSAEQASAGMSAPIPMGEEDDPWDDLGGSAGTSASLPVAGASGASGTGSFASGGSASAGMGGAGGGAGSGVGVGDSDGSAPAGVGGASGEGGGSQLPQSGQLTAGTWDDNRNFERFSEYRSELLQQSSGIVGVPMPTSDGEHAQAHERFEQLGAARALLDISLVIDTTGSMSDEIAYLQSELISISERIESDYPDAEQRWSLIVYRDEGDAYVVRSFDFTADVAAMRVSLQAQSADGGGDFPEAPDAALAAANDLAWRMDDDVARLVFWVADAPHHDDKADELKTAIMEAQALDVHLYPVASSGIDELTELTMRSAAQLTGGRYLFLTSDSGIGGEHKEPTIPCYFVTKLKDAIVRMVDIEMSGAYREPTKDEIIRTGGDPQDGACELEGGEQVLVF